MSPDLLEQRNLFRLHVQGLRKDLEADVQRVVHEYVNAILVEVEELQAESDRLMERR